ncbi:sorting nexin-29-related [Holotrichia oblita]|uniref:Sorting nexin-29-related n=1 Tax=Holotrichia oblita TaxID=644536 RepID=A0ACB9T341_HOLOL|nr:sorting nexin-29-related [Holotrichia oblita]
MSTVIPISTTSTSVSSTHSKSEDSGKLLNQLLECVQHCQKRFGGKTELATEFDSCVAALCLSLESVLLHGLRQKPIPEGQTSALRQVSDIVSNTLHLSNDSLSFWPFVSKHLTKHEKERYGILKQIWTDIGRGKAWIRSALNEKTLERYFHTILCNKELLRCYYEDWALILDEEKNSMLPNMAAGLGSILFAISIDKSELNVGNATEKMDKLKAMVEPIIQAPIPDNNVHKKRVVPKQVISFDDEENILSSSVPSSSSSVTSDTNSSNELRTNLDNKGSNSNRQSDLPSNSEVKLKRKLSFEASGSRDKFQNSIDGPLTPIQSNIGELTPISVETIIDSPEVNETICKDIPIDISAVFTEIEKKNVEFMKLNEKIAFLNKENTTLKEQLNKYVGAVQMLKQGNGSLQKTLEDLQIDGQKPDYKHEAKIFEKKLVQVAEMHAELMDFNVHLQQSLCQKDKIIERLVSELEEVRGPMPLDDITEDSRHVINVWIPSAFLTGSGSDAHHVYQIFLRAGCDEWNIYRRYAQFYALHSDLKKLDSVVSTFDFPPKKSLGKRDAALVEDRRKRLQTYLRRVLMHWPELSQCNSKFLLEQHLGFFKYVEYAFTESVD